MSAADPTWRRTLLDLSRALTCALCTALWASPLWAGGEKPYFKRRMPRPQLESDFASNTFFIDFGKVHGPAYPDDPGDLFQYTCNWDERAAAIVSDAVGLEIGIRIYVDPDAVDLSMCEEGERHDEAGCAGATHQRELVKARNLLEWKPYEEIAELLFVPTGKTLAAMAYADYFPTPAGASLRDLVGPALLKASPGFCGTFGPGVDDVFDLMGSFPEGNYDMAQMHLLPLAYAYWDELSAEARKHLVWNLLGKGTILRPGVDYTLTSGGTPDDWSRAGYVSPMANHRNISETENHQLMILTARYLTNQLLFQQEPDVRHDNRRNGGDGRPHTHDVVLYLLRNFLRGDFSEYNAKNYQKETRWALLNLASFAYDDDVRLAARMVLDYVSARMAVTSSDLRRMVPFRRRNESENGKNATVDGFMAVGLVDWLLGADPLLPYFALQTGNLRALAEPIPEGPDHHIRALPWILGYNGYDETIEVVSTYRLPPSIHDLFVNDGHRRFHQRMHRTPRSDEHRGNRNCDNVEINAGSPSYLLTAGGKPCGYAIDPNEQAVFSPEEPLKQVGVAVSTSFMPTTQEKLYVNTGLNLLQFGSFSDQSPEIVFPRARATGPVKSAGSALPPPLDFFYEVYAPLNPGIPGVRKVVEDLKHNYGVTTMFGAANYCVAPDFACGHRVHLPGWIPSNSPRVGKFTFVNRDGGADRPGFYLAIYRDGDFGFMEAYDTWLYRDLSFEEFKRRVVESNPNLRLASNVENHYVTQTGNGIRFVIWTNGERENAVTGAEVLEVRYGSRDRTSAMGNASPAASGTHNGTVLRSQGDWAVEVVNPFLGTSILLDMSDPERPRRTDEHGVVEEAGGNSEVWLDTAWTHQSEGDFFRPYKTLADAIAGVARGGRIRITPASIRETPIRIDKPVTLVAPIGGVTIGPR